MYVGTLAGEEEGGEEIWTHHLCLFSFLLWRRIWIELERRHSGLLALVHQLLLDGLRRRASSVGGRRLCLCSHGRRQQLDVPPWLSSRIDAVQVAATSFIRRAGERRGVRCKTARRGGGSAAARGDASSQGGLPLDGVSGCRSGWGCLTMLTGFWWLVHFLTTAEFGPTQAQQTAPQLISQTHTHTRTHSRQRWGGRESN